MEGKKPTTTNTKPPMDKPISLSRFREDKMDDPKIMVDYYLEHAPNIHFFFEKILEAQNFLRMLERAKYLILRLNQKSDQIPQSYNMVVIGGFFDRLMGLCNQSDQNRVKYFLDGMNTYFQILKVAGVTKMAQIGSLFSNKEVLEKMAVLLDATLEKGYDKETAGKWFMPSLLHTFTYTFTIYDGATQGKLVHQALQDFSHHRVREQEKSHLEASQNPATLKKTWGQAATEMPKGPAEPFSYNQFEDLEPSNPQQEEEVNALSEFADETRLDFQAMWNFKKDQFTENWKSLTDTERIRYIKKARKIAATWSEQGIRYCPELDPADLIKQNSKELFQLIETALEYKRDIGFLDQFVSQISQKMKREQNYSKKSLVMISFSRRLTICKFLVILIFESLKLIEEQQEKQVTQTEFIDQVMKLPDPKQFNGPKFDSKDESDDEHEIEELTTKIENTSVNSVAGPRSQIVENLPASSQVDQSKQKKPSEEPSKPARKCTRCQKTENPKEKPFPVCSACRKFGTIVPYCSGQCQNADWKNGHKLRCGKKNPDIPYGDVD